MKKKRILVVIASLVLIFVSVSLRWPKRVHLISKGGDSVEGLQVMLLRGAEWDVAVADEEGLATLGHGLWSLTGRSSPQVLVVLDDERIYWEGVVAPSSFQCVALEIGPGRPHDESSHNLPKKPD